MQIILNARSSDGKSVYPVEFRNEGNSLSAVCTCQAGQYGRCCKHIVSLLAGDHSMLSDRSQQNQMNSVVDWSREHGILEQIGRITADEKEIEKMKRKLKRMKDAMWNEIRGN